jgi:N-methylhydantoinase B
MPKQPDPLLISVLDARLGSIAIEMGMVMVKTARSPIFSQAHDFSCFIADSEGRVLSQQDGIPIHTGSGGFAIRALLEFWRGNIHPGDVFLQNDPYTAGNNHLPDWTVTVPVFVDGTLVGFVANRAHQADIGGGVLGTYNPYATEIYHEGLRLPPMKIHEGGMRRDDVQALLRLNCRLPEIMESDLDAMVGSTHVGARGFADLIARYGVEATQRHFNELLDASEEAMRTEIDRIPDGTYVGSDSMNNDCFKYREVTVRVAVKVDGRDIQVDFSGTDPQIEGFKNSALTNTCSAVYLAISTMVDPHIPHNEGTYRPIAIIAPDGCLVNALPPAPVTYSTVFPAHEIIHAIWKALGPAVPSRWTAGWGKNAFPISGSRAGDPDGYVFYHWNAASGAGAVAGSNGFEQLGPVVTLGGLSIPNLEVYEKLYPVRFHRHELREDGGGAGQWRGGSGVEYEVTFESESQLTWRGDGHRSASGYGASGGRDGEPAHVCFVPAPVEGELPPYGVWDFADGTHMSLQSPGGGGWGDPSLRDPQDVAFDVRCGLVSEGMASDEYGVVLDEAGDVDAEATALRRKR